MFLYPPITRLDAAAADAAALTTPAAANAAAADARAPATDRLNDAFKDIFAPMCRVAKQHSQSWKRKQRKEFARLARKLHEADPL
jgi:hypothetical protein